MLIGGFRNKTQIFFRSEGLSERRTTASARLLNGKFWEFDVAGLKRVLRLTAIPASCCVAQVHAVTIEPNLQVEFIPLVHTRMKDLGPSIRTVSGSKSTER